MNAIPIQHRNGDNGEYGRNGDDGDNGCVFLDGMVFE